MPGPKETRPLTHERLKEVLDYDRHTGEFTWKVRQARNTHVGARAGGVRNGKYYIRIDKDDYTAARLAWFYVHGVWPVRLNFKDKDVANVRLSNLVESAALPEKYDHSTQAGRIEYFKASRKHHKNTWQDRDLRRNFGITLADYQVMHAAQHGVCAICGKEESSSRSGNTLALAVDHHHASGKIRDLLCSYCNKMIGYAREDVAILEKAIEYLKKHSAQ